MNKYNGLPAGCESSCSEDEMYDDGLVNSSKSRNPPKPVVKTPLEQKKKKLLDLVTKNNLVGIQEELDHGLVKGFNIDEPLDSRWNILYQACYLGFPEIVDFLINERGACINTMENNESPLMVACYSSADSANVFKVVKALTDKAAMISSTNIYGVTALMFACGKGHVKVVQHLLSLNDSYDAIDNEGRNALFHAIDAKSFETAKLLVEAGIDLTVTDKFGSSAKQHASNELQSNIVELFPPEVVKYQIPCNFLSYNRFEDLFPGADCDVPAYFPDILVLLRGMGCEQFNDKFAQAEVTLEDFLTMTDEKLKEIGIGFPFERNMIRLGLYNFHKQAWTRRSLYVPADFKTDLSSLDLVMMLANVLRQVVIIKSHFLYMKQLSAIYNLREARDYITMNHLNEFKQNVKQLKKGFKKLIAASPSSRPLLIAKKSKKKSISSILKFTVLAAAPIVIFCAIKGYKK